jgi:hypothetical protein
VRRAKLYYLRDRIGQGRQDPREARRLIRTRSNGAGSPRGVSEHPSLKGRPMSSDDLENFEAERELQLAQEYQDVAGMFRFAVETERRFYLANEVKVTVSGDGASRPVIEVQLTDAWVWDMYRKSRFVPKVRVLSFKDVNVEELPVPDLQL